MDKPIGIAAGLIKKASHVPKGLQEYVNHITFGSFTLEAREGNKEPTYWFNQETQSSINAIGLKNDGIEQFMREEMEQILRIKHADCRYRISIAPLKTGDAGHMLEYIHTMSGDIFEVEINAACPNHRSEGGLHPVLAHDPEALGILMAEAQDFPGIKAIKIAPRMSNESLRSVVELVQQCKFGAIVSGNTLLSDSTIGGIQRLSVPKGGMGGAILLEDSIQQVMMLRAICDGKKIMSPELTLIGCGGIMTEHDVRRFLKADADGGVQVATYFNEFGIKGIRDLASVFA